MYKRLEKLKNINLQLKHVSRRKRGNKMKVKETRFAKQIKFDSKKEIIEYLENAKNGQWLLSYSLYPNGIENIGKTSDGQCCSFAHGVNWSDKGISIMTLKCAVDNLWKENGRIYYSERECVCNF